MLSQRPGVGTARLLLIGISWAGAGPLPSRVSRLPLLATFAPLEALQALAVLVATFAIPSILSSAGASALVFGGVGPLLLHSETKKR